MDFFSHWLKDGHGCQRKKVTGIFFDDRSPCGINELPPPFTMTSFLTTTLCFASSVVIPQGKLEERPATGL
jgi:hypothetical protein